MYRCSKRVGHVSSCLGGQPSLIIQIMGWVGEVSSQKMERYRLSVAPLYAEVQAYSYYVNVC